MLSSLSSNVVLAKARAKYGKRLKEKDYRNLLDCKSVAEVAAYLKANTDYHDVLTGINQESVFTKILWDEDRFVAASPEDRDYFLDYIERYASQGAEIYLLEYTRDRRLIAEIQDYCQKKGFQLYISDSLELDEKSAPRKHL